MISVGLALANPSRRLGESIRFALNIDADAPAGTAVTLPTLPAGLYYVPGVYENAFGCTLTITSQSEATVDLDGAFNALPEGVSVSVTWIVPTTDVSPNPGGNAIQTEAGLDLLTETGVALTTEAA